MTRGACCGLQAMAVGGAEGHFIYVCTKKAATDRQVGAGKSLPHAGSRPHDSGYDKRRMLMSDGHGADAEPQLQQSSDKRMRTS